MVSIDALVRDESTNARIGWVLTGAVAVTAVRSALAGDPLWGGFALLAVVVMGLPAASTGRWTVMVPWPLLATVAAAVIAGASGAYRETAGYVAVATLALVAVAELDAFTPVEMSRRFAVGFTALTTMAVQALWTVAQFYSDLWLGTEFLRSQAELQWDIVAATGVGVVLGGVFLWYFEWFEPVGTRERPIVSTDES